MNKIKNIIGLRTIKTGITVFLATIIAGIIAPEQSFVIIFTSIVALESTVLSSYATGLKRTINTIVGAIIATILAYLPIPLEYAMPIAVILLIVASNKIGSNSSIGISASVLILILIAKDTDPLMYGIVRLRDTFIGILLALTVNIIVFPPKLKQRLIDDGRKLYDELLFEVSSVLLFGNTDTIDSFREKISKFNQDIHDIKEEIGFKRMISNPEILQYKELLLNYEKITIYLQSLSLMNKSFRFDQENAEMIKKYFSKDVTYITDRKTESRDEILYNYLIKKVFESLTIISSYSSNLNINKVRVKLS